MTPEQIDFEARGKLTALSFWHRMPGADAAELVAFIAVSTLEQIASTPRNKQAKQSARATLGFIKTQLDAISTGGAG